MYHKYAVHSRITVAMKKVMAKVTLHPLPQQCPEIVRASSDIPYFPMCGAYRIPTEKMSFGIKLGYP